ncbi:MAG TPA: hypothetical protein VGJ20_40855 [Xanthobacteraceae bacterium]|jgi:hypothetical protein
MIKLTLVAAAALAGIPSSAFAYSAVGSHQSAVQHNNKIALDWSSLYADDPPPNQCEQARQVGWPHTSCVYD